MTSVEELALTLRAVAAALDALGTEWAVGGSYASTAHGEPRATNDVDVIARLDEAGARKLAELLGPDFYCSTEAALEAVLRCDSFNVVDHRTFLKVDLFVPPPGPMGVGQLARRRPSALGGSVIVPVLAPEDIVLQKLRWYRLSGGVSDRQWRDVIGVLRGAARLDDAYLDEVAGPAGLADLLARARAEAR